jgi:hypothetical protein
MLQKKGILRKRGTASTRTAKPAEPSSVAEEPSAWEALLDGCDGFCCRPLFGDYEAEAETENRSDDGEESRTPSEIYINTESSKTLVTV